MGGGWWPGQLSETLFQNQKINEGKEKVGHVTMCTKDLGRKCPCPQFHKGQTGYKKQQGNNKTLPETARMFDQIPRHCSIVKLTLLSHSSHMFSLCSYIWRVFSTFRYFRGIFIIWQVRTFNVYFCFSVSFHSSTDSVPNYLPVNNFQDLLSLTCWNRSTLFFSFICCFVWLMITSFNLETWHHLYILLPFLYWN